MQTIITIPKSITGDEDLVVLRRQAYEELQSRVLPLVVLKGRAAARVDRRVRASVRDVYERKTVPFETFLKRDYPHLHRVYAQ